MKIESNSYYNLPYFVERLRKLRGDEEDYSINFTLIILFTTFLESVLYDLLNQTIGESFDLETIDGRLANNISTKINKANWTEFTQLADLVLNKGLKDCVDAELWNSIQILFDYRNQIIHGKSFIFEKSTKDGKTIHEYKGKYQKIYNFLNEKKLLDVEAPGLLSSKIVDYFWERSKDFSLKVAKELQNSENGIVFLMLNDAITDSMIIIE